MLRKPSSLRATFEYLAVIPTWYDFVFDYLIRLEWSSREEGLASSALPDLLTNGMFIPREFELQPLSYMKLHSLGCVFCVSSVLFPWIHKLIFHTVFPCNAILSTLSLGKSLAGYACKVSSQVLGEHPRPSLKDMNLGY